MNNGNFHSFLNLFNFLTDQRNNFFYYSFDLFDPVDIDNFFLNYLDLLDCWYFDSNFDYLFHNLGDFFDLLNCLNDWNNLLNNFLNNLRNLFNVVHNLSRSLILNGIDQFLYNLFDFNNNWLFHNPLDYLLDYDLNLLNLLNHLLDNNSLLFIEKNFLYLWYNLVNYFLDNYRLFYFHNLFFDYFYLNYFWDLHSSFYYLFNYSWYLNNLFLDLLNLHYFLNYPVHIFDYLDGEMNNLLYFLYFDHFNNFLNYLLNW